ncbi:MAG: MFS transporter [Firmicutes bacterium]|nr:MFS transporter [Bacillota bacterium]
MYLPVKFVNSLRHGWYIMVIMQDSADELRVKNPGVDAIRRTHYAVWILLAGVLTNFGCIGLGRFAIGMIIPEMGRGLSLTNTQIGIIVSGTFLGYLMSTVLSGALATRFGARKVIAVSMSTVAVAMVVAGMAVNFWMALFGQLLVGIGAGGGNVPAVALVSRWYAQEFRGTASGIALTGSGLGFAITGIFIPYMLGIYGGAGWRASWFYLSAVVFLIGFFGVLVFRNSPEEVGLRPFGSFDNSDKDSSTSIDKTLKTTGKSNKGQMHWRDIYLSKALWELGFIYLMFGFSYVVFTTFFAKYLIEEIGFTQGSAGQLWSAVGILSIASGFIWGILSDKIGRRNALFIVYSLQGLCLLMLAFINSPVAIATVSLLYSLTLWSIPSIMAATCADYVGGVFASAALGMITIFFGVGQVMSPWISGYIKDMTHSFAIPFMASGVASFIGALLTALLPKRGVHEPESAVQGL